MSKLTGIRFNNSDHPDFTLALRKRVNQYFKDNKIDKHSNFNMKVKTVFMLSLYFIPFTLLLTNFFESQLVIFFLWLLMGFGLSGIGLSIMHDANHGAYSKNGTVNKLLGFVLNFVGGYHINWKIQHNVLHHSYTNIHGHDQDIESGMFRLSPTQDTGARFKYQAFYAPFFYSLMTIYWITFKDFVSLKSYKEEKLLEAQNISYKTAVTQAVIYKVLYYLLTLVLPLVVVNAPTIQIVLGFVCMHLLGGLILALIFQPAHVLEETEFVIPEKQPDSEDFKTLENSWAIHQMKTTSNFAMKSRWFSWLIGGLNYQVEHHLFPNICHVHYRKISGIVSSTAKEFGVPYKYHKTFYGALRSHFKLLYQLGRAS